MEEAFGTLVWIVVAVSVLVALVTLAGAASSYRRIGDGGIVHDADGAPPSSPAAERDDEIRQLLEARNARRERRGEATLDVDAELAELTRGEPAAAVDEGLREEIRAHVVARNDRRVRAGAEPLDVEAEVERRLRDPS